MTDTLRYGYAFDPEGNSWAARLLKKVPAGARVLELGPGPGAMTRVLCELGHDVCVVEGDADAIESLKKLNVTIVNADLNLDAWQKSLQGQKFDAILACDVLEHLIYPEEVLRQLRDFLIPDGVLIVSVPNIAYAGVLAGLSFDAFDYSSKGLLDVTHLKFFTKRTLSKSLLGTGWLPISWESNNLPIERSEFFHFWELLDNKSKQFLMEKSPYYDVYQWMVVARTTNDTAAWEGTVLQSELEQSRADLCSLRAIHSEERASLKEHQKAFSEALVLIDGYKKDIEKLHLEKEAISSELSRFRNAGFFRSVIRRFFN